MPRQVWRYRPEQMACGRVSGVELTYRCGISSGVLRLRRQGRGLGPGGKSSGLMADPDPKRRSGPAAPAVRPPARPARPEPSAPPGWRRGTGGRVSQSRGAEGCVNRKCRVLVVCRSIHCGEDDPRQHRTRGPPLVRGHHFDRAPPNRSSRPENTSRTHHTPSRHARPVTTRACRDGGEPTGQMVKPPSTLTVAPVM
jgi:hypothetical protein